MNHSMELVNRLVEGAGVFGADLEPARVEDFFLYKELLREGNEKMNLTAIESDSDIIVKHFIDSISVLPSVDSICAAAAAGKKPTLIDVGSGAGFPGIPIKILRRGIDITLLDSLDKRVGYLNDVIARLQLPDIRALHGRAEEYAHKPGFREAFDIAAARAVAGLPVLLEFCLPFVKVGGVFLAMKGGGSASELAASKRALEELGGRVAEVREFVLPGTDMKRCILEIRKFRQTPTIYPRKPGKPAKVPL